MTTTAPTSPAVPLYPESQKIQLPSRGVLYEGKLPDGWVNIRPFSTDEMELLVSPRGDRFELLNEVIDACLLSREVPLQDMLSGDRMFLLLQIRQLTVGSDYAVQLPCRGCQGTVMINLSLEKDLSIRALEETDQEPFECLLPVCGKKLGLRLLRVKDEAAILRYAARPSAVSNRKDPSYKYRLACCIATIDGSAVDVMTALRLIETPLHGRDSLVLERTYEKHDCGPDMILTTVCPRCSASMKDLIPLTDEFFRPQLGPALDGSGGSEPVPQRGDG